MIEFCLVLSVAYVMGTLLWTYAARAIARERYESARERVKHRG